MDIYPYHIYIYFALPNRIIFDIENKTLNVIHFFKSPAGKNLSESVSVLLAL